MCGQKLEKVQSPIPLRPNPSSRSPKFRVSTSKSTDLSSGTNISNFSKESQITSASSTSLSSLRASLPQRPILFSLSEISRATNNFRSQKLGGRSSMAWKCALREKQVAVLQRNVTYPIEFQSVLSDLCSIHHKEVIKLIGGCLEGETIFLVYEFEDGLSLSDCLRGSKIPGFTVLSSWVSRIQIALDVAKALEYMHHDIPLVYVHKYLKGSSIIVFEPEYRAKVANFGASILTGEFPMKFEEHSGSKSEIMEENSVEFGGRVRRYGSRKIVGTQGYMAPEYVSDGVITQKSDVFSFGVVVLEILSGEEPVKYVHDKENNEFKKVSLIENVGSILAEPLRLRTWVDSRLKDSYPVECAERVIQIAASCVDLDPKKRPDMRWVSVEMSRVLMKSEKWAQNLRGRKGVTVTFEAR
ncbi:hypothetical protein AMTRI_Chr03g137940 [Amborella trichopoda]|uniref:Protein kinase domain-containing protein n=1 Tax=Amborella trichopoda TaxID=13333 RepID=W1PN31_AMBTC|nr:lysM domain receptor-like kinase 3 [Amborella trichopoda]ERN11437.1 hypothetical protein AMTR_s00022p00058190 [Amborella trichopoda]|eukprot:XP_006849856.1 lysM domain receptor-like kinase 3 [Amborella trichopoda]